MGAEKGQGMSKSQTYDNDNPLAIRSAVLENQAMKLAFLGFSAKHRPFDLCSQGGFSLPPPIL